MLEFIYNRFKPQFHDLLVKEFFGFIPESVKEPSVEFLGRGRETLEKFFSIQAYSFQRRSIMDNKNADVYKGVLIHIRAMLVLLQKSPRPVQKITPDNPKKEEIDPVSDFLNAGKKLIAKRNENVIK